MSHAADVPDDRASLRQRASAQLSGHPQTDLKRLSTHEALAVLHQLASSPSTASDAMALLHELQVHQVEVELQQEELRRSRSELELALDRQTALLERWPVGHMTLDAGTVLREINPAGTRLLGAAREALLGRPLTSLLSAPSASLLQALLARARDGQLPETRELRLLPIAGQQRSVHAAAARDTTAECFLLVLMAMPDEGNQAQ